MGGFVAGGPPRSLGTANTPVTRRNASQKKIIQNITKYMADETNDKKGTQKVYIEEDAVVNCEESCINVQFQETSYLVNVATGSATFVLGPVNCGHINPEKSSWRLSKGKVSQFVW